MKNQIWRIFLCCYVTVMLLTLGVLAADIVDSGACGDNLTWTLDSEGALTISGMGKMDNYDNTSSNHAPWYAKRANIVTVVINDGVTTIGSYAFDTCYSLTSVIISDGVVSIGESAFSVCNRLTNITLPDNVTTVGKAAFYGCEKLTRVIIPDSVTIIGEGTFSRCENLEIIDVNINNSLYSSVDGVLFDKNQSILVTYPCGKKETAYNIPDSVNIIGDWAFYECSSLISVTIPSSVTTIGDWAFDFCYSLTSITIPDSVTTIGEMAFANCQGLISVTMPNSVVTIGYGAFFQCSITSVIISSNITTISNEVFKNCDKLERIAIPDSVTFIGDLAFCNCTNLERVIMPHSVANIGKGAFYGCDKLTDIDYAGNLSQWNEIAIDDDNYPLSFVAVHCADGELLPSKSVIVAQGYCGAENNGTNLQWVLTSDKTLTIKGFGAMQDYQTFWEAFGDYSLMQPWYEYNGYVKTVIIENGVTSIGRSGLWAFNKMTSVAIPDSVTSFGISAFSHCGSLTHINLPDGITSISKDIFSSCYNLTSIVIPNGVSVIEDGAFQNCYALNNAIIPYGVTSIGAWAFRNCDGMTSVTIPASVTTIDEGSFEECDNLISVTIGNGMTSIGYGAFYDCKNLKSVTIPTSVIGIGRNAFRFCSNVVLYVYENSYAYTYAIENELAYEFISNTVGTVHTGTVKTVSVASETCDVTLDCSDANVSAGTTYQILYALCDEHGQLLSVGSADVTFDADTSADFTIEGVQAGVTCRIFLINGKTAPQCAATHLNFAG